MISVGRGSDHGATLRREPVNAFSHLFQLQLSLRHVSVESLVTFRAAWESWALREIAGRLDNAVASASTP
jgi:hypothetical protein